MAVAVPFTAGFVSKVCVIVPPSYPVPVLLTVTVPNFSVEINKLVSDSRP